MKNYQLNFFYLLLLLILSPVSFSYAQYPPSHDPSTMIRNTDGRYWIFTTGQGVWAMSSSNADFTNWQAEPTPFAIGTWPSWINNYVDNFSGDFWAPDVIYMNGYYYLYYSASSFGTSKSAIGVARSSSLNGNWTDLGLVVSSNGSSNAINAIDPALFRDTNGNIWMSYGSWFGGLGVVQINPSTGKTMGNVTHIAGGGHQDREAPFIMKNGSYYYLFSNRGTCCNGLNSSYYVVVARATSVTGPYTNEQTFISNQNGNIVGPGHIGYNEGRLTYHFYDGNDNGNAKLMVRTDFGFANGWPYIGTPPPSNGIISGGTYRITPRHSNKSLDVENCGNSAGTNVRQWTWLNNNCQKWIFTDVGDGYWRISPANAPSLALDLDYCSNANLANIQLWNWLNNDCQKWQLIDRGNGYYSIQSKASGKCLDIEGVSSSDGANLLQYTCYSTSYNQQFSFESVSSSRFSQNQISSLSQANTFQVYPNPTQHTININLGELAGYKTQLTLINSVGQLVYRTGFEGNRFSFDIHNLKSGLYILRVENLNGVRTIKIQKE